MLQRLSDRMSACCLAAFGRDDSIPYGRTFGEKGRLEQKVGFDLSAHIVHGHRCIDELLEGESFALLSSDG